MSYAEGWCNTTGARVFYVKDLNEDEAVCEVHGYVYVDEGHVSWRDRAVDDEDDGYRFDPVTGESRLYREA